MKIMRSKEDQIKGEKLIQSPEDLNLLLTELHKSQHPDVFSDIAQSFGWCPRQVPGMLTAKVMKGIKEEQGCRFVNPKIIWSVGFLFVFMLFFIMFSLIRLENSLELGNTIRMEIGLFWLIVSFGVSLFAFTISIFAGECYFEKRLG